jgi:glycosyltransferase involved in cell wall biosynthesis
MRSNPRVLYITYWGAAEPLGRSLVIPAVKRLAELGVVCTLLTFEKSEDLAEDLDKQSELCRIRDSLEGCGVKWIPVRYHKRPRVPATVFDLAHGVCRGILVGLRSRPDVIHARTFVGGLIGLVLAPLLGARLIYHNEGFYPDEQVDGGVWKAGSLQHRIARHLEKMLYRRADGIIALSDRGRDQIEHLWGVARKGTPVIVVPSCVDLSHFRAAQPGMPGRQGGLRLVYIGSVGGRYILDRIGRFSAIASEMAGEVHLKVLTRAEPDLVVSMLEASGLSPRDWSMAAVSRERMPEELSGQDAGLFFLAQGLSEHGCSPTKIGEYWAMGLPIVTTANVSDNDEIIRRERVGVIVNDHTDAEYRRAIDELNALLKEPDLASRCRRAAEDHYALTPACERQVGLYRKLIEGCTNVEAIASGEGHRINCQ